MVIKMARIKEHLKISKRTRNIVLAFLLILISDFLAAGLWTSLLHGRFLGWSQTRITCDLLFLEGAIIFTIGAFLASGITWLLRVSRHPRGRDYVKEKRDNDIKKSRKKQLKTGMFMMILGAMLIGSSVTIGQLFL